ncbi:undecaprenyl-diphosphate phosphatase [Magnetococcales bacterium HHB-1]
MDAIHATILALIQGITEFLPVSSSGHLILVPFLFHWPDQGLWFDIAVNTGSWMAVVWYFREDIKRVFFCWWKSICLGKWRDMPPDGLMVWWVALATVPVGLVGFIFKDFIALWGRNPQIIAWSSLLFGLLMGWADSHGKQSRDLSQLRWQDALFFGFAQALALIPGASRSGVTLTAGLLQGFSREAAARFSFWMAIPVGALAGGLDLFEGIFHPPAGWDWSAFFIGLVVSFISAYVIIDWLLAWLRQRTLTLFVWYRVVLAMLIFVLAYF